MNIPTIRAGSHDNQKRVVAAQDDLAEASLLCDRCAILDAGAILQNEPVRRAPEPADPANAQSSNSIELSLLGKPFFRRPILRTEEPLCRTGV